MKKFLAFLLSCLIFVFSVSPALAEDIAFTINISDYSIDALANALGGGDYSVTNNSGLQIPVPTAVYNNWNLHGSDTPRMALMSKDGYLDWILMPSSQTVQILVSVESDSCKLSYSIVQEMLYFDGSAGVTYFINNDEEYIDTPSGCTTITSGSFSDNAYPNKWFRPYDSSWPLNSVYYYNVNVYDEDSGDLLRSADGVESVEEYTITLDFGFDDMADESITVSPLSVEISDPVYDGYSFVGWYYDSDFTERFSAGDTICSDTTLYAKWVSTGMAFFADTVFGSFSTLFTAQPILYLLSLMGLALIIGIFKSWCDARC